jgi:putative transposase
LYNINMKKNNKDYMQDEHRVHYICYHLVWSPKRRKKVLIGKIAEDCDRLIREKCSFLGWKIIQLSIQPDHIHLFVQSFPSVAAETIVKECKGYVSYAIRNKYEDLKKLPCLWTRSYFASTAGMVSSDIIAKYIESQSKN